MADRVIMPPFSDGERDKEVEELARDLEPFWWTRNGAAHPNAAAKRDEVRAQARNALAWSRSERVQQAIYKAHSATAEERRKLQAEARAAMKGKAKDDDK